MRPDLIDRLSIKLGVVTLIVYLGLTIGKWMPVVLGWIRQAP